MCEYHSDFLPLLSTSHVYKLLRVFKVLSLSWEVGTPTPGPPVEKRPLWSSCMSISPACRVGGCTWSGGEMRSPQEMGTWHQGEGEASLVATSVPSLWNVASRQEALPDFLIKRRCCLEGAAEGGGCGGGGGAWEPRPSYQVLIPRKKQQRSLYPPYTTPPPRPCSWAA